MTNYRYLPLIAGVFTATLVISNTIATKIISVGPINLAAGIILFPIAYVFGDVLTEVYGYSASRKVIWAGVISQIVMVISYALAGALPPADFWHNQVEFEKTLNPVPQIALGSLCALFVGEFANSYVLAKLKVKMAGKSLSIRFVLSTLIGQLFDSIVFAFVAFGGIFEISKIIYIIICGWSAKVLWEILALPITIPITNWLKKAEGVDYYDKETNFNPFIIKG
jgi:uncharacterized integral membrane protein (TIGR00697 family)